MSTETVNPEVTPEVTPQEIPVEKTEVTPEVTPPETPVEKPEDKMFDPNSISFENSIVAPDSFTELAQELGIDIDNEQFGSYVSNLSDKGFSKEQIEEVVRLHTPSSKPPSNDEVKKILETNLSQEEKRDYPAVNRMVAEALPEDTAKFIMQDPTAVGIIHKLYKHFIVGGKNVGENPQQAKQTSTLMSYEDALSKWTETVNGALLEGRKLSSEEITSLRKNLIDNCVDPDTLKEVIG